MLKFENARDILLYVLWQHTNTLIDIDMTQIKRSIVQIEIINTNKNILRVRNAKDGSSSAL